ncbi:hypothetical protein J1N35_041059 [Gossypium stocksii]|uniref:RNase H type-1 domain-containing protein n=1 Tax=Gossypium stocksii TaxID=47602 RepID=A0A9D3UF18_9ROSI|nr:hypothetical protein J1N35_041059 [Gossypium stocksii]
MLPRNCTVPEGVLPRDPFVRINVDAAYDPKEFTSGSGLVARNIRGEILVTKSTLTTNPMAHAIATESLKRGVKMYLVGSVSDFVRSLGSRTQ